MMATTTDSEAVLQRECYAERVERIRRQALPDNFKSITAGELGDLPAHLYTEKADRSPYVLVIDLDATERELS